MDTLVRGVTAVLGQGEPLAREVTELGSRLVRVATGSSDLAPHAQDKRFADATWSDSPVYRRVAQAYLALVAALDGLLADLEESAGDWRTIERARLAHTVLTSALAPTNTLPGNPAALKRAFETGGSSLLRGLGNWISDVRHNRGMPAQVDASTFVTGRDLALTAGSVVQRDDVAELIQYAPTTDTVEARPLLVVPPPIGRFHFLDLRPGRSFVEYALSQGRQVFMLSWRNPGPEHREWGIDTYAGRIVGALDAVDEITGHGEADLLGFCAGGILTSTVLNHLAHIGSERVRTASLAVTLLDFDVRAAIGAFSAPRALALAADRSRSQGVLAAKDLGAVFSWMRPDDLVFGYVINNYLLGEDPPAFDILAWNADGTNLPARLHQEFLDAFSGNLLAEPDALTVLGSPVDLGRITVPMFITGARSDHLTPWPGCYRTTQLVGGDCTFALSNSGHVASLVNPPGNPRASFRVGPAGGSPDTWEAAAPEQRGSWWEGWSAWLEEHSGGKQTPAPRRLGSAAHPPLDAAPGRYVRDLTP